MKVSQAFLIALFMLIGVGSLSQKFYAQGSPISQAGCSAIDKSKPPLFISFESLTAKAWAGDDYEKGVLLRLSNNSNCTVSFSASYHEAPRVPPTFVFRNGKMVRQPDVKFGSLTNGQRASLYYLTKYPGKESLVIGGFGGDMLETVYLNGGDYVFFGVPLRNFKKGGEILLPYNYDWDEGEASQIITERGGYKQRYETVEHYLRFVSGQLPDNALR
jgi:hypothetical protein